MLYVDYRGWRGKDGRKRVEGRKRERERDRGKPFRVTILQKSFQETMCSGL